MINNHTYVKNESHILRLIMSEVYMQFKYELIGTGWANGFIELNSQKILFSPSYITDAFGDLLGGLTDLSSGEERVVTFLWEEEPHGLGWRLELQDSKELFLTITEYNDTLDYIKGKEGVTIVDATCNFLDFVKMVIIEADKILLRYGIVGYQNLWAEHEFPLSSYLQLKYFLMEADKISLQTKEKCEKKELKQELQFLIRNFNF